jgi:Flp pilus assembly protein TadG
MTPRLESTARTLHPRRRLRHCERERGAAAVEFALVLPLLILLIFGVVEFSITYNRQQALHAAAREGARTASLPSSTQTNIHDAVTNALTGVNFTSTPSISTSPAATQPCSGRSGQTVTVTVQASTNLDIPLWGNDVVTLTGRGEFRCE